MAKTGTKSAATLDKTVCVEQVRSKIGCTVPQLQSLRGLGLGKIGKKMVLQDNNCVRGLIRKVAHLVKVGDSNE